MTRVNIVHFYTDIPGFIEPVPIDIVNASFKEVQCRSIFKYLTLNSCSTEKIRDRQTPYYKSDLS